MTAAREITSLGYRVKDEGQGVGVVMVITEVCQKDQLQVIVSDYRVQKMSHRRFFPEDEVFENEGKDWEKGDEFPGLTG